MNDYFSPTNLHLYINENWYCKSSSKSKFLMMIPFKKINTSSKGLYLKTVLTICKNSKQISICLKWKDKFNKFLFTILIYPCATDQK